MKYFNLVAALVLIGCSGPAFSTAENRIGGDISDAGKDSLAGEAGEDNSAGFNSAGSSTSEGGYMNQAGTNTGGTAGVMNGGSMNGGTGGAISGSSSGGNGGIAGSSGNTGTAGMGGNTTTKTCSKSQNGQACIGMTYTWEGTTIPATDAWECPEVTSESPTYLEQNSQGNTVRQCVESKFGAPNNLWCCTPPQ